MIKIDLNVFNEDILNTVKEAIVVLDDNYKVVFVNKSFCDIFKMKESKVIGEVFFKLEEHNHWNREDLKKILKEILKDEIRSEEMNISGEFSKIGQKFFELRIKQLKDGTRKKKYAVITISDVTLKKQVLETAFQSNKLAMIGQFSAGIAHGMSSPLTGIYNFLEVYLKEEKKGTEKHEELEMMIEACVYMNNIVRNLSYFSRNIKDEMTEVSLKDVIDSTLIFTERQFIASNIFIEKQISKNVKNILGIKSQLQHVLLNLLINSKESQKGGGKIKIKLANYKKNQVFLEVSDDGKGIDPKDLPHVFEPFFTTKEVKLGSGLGLSAAHGIIKKHGASISMDSKLGKGTKVKIIFNCK